MTFRHCRKYNFNSFTNIYSQYLYNKLVFSCKVLFHNFCDPNVSLDATQFEGLSKKKWNSINFFICLIWLQLHTEMLVASRIFHCFTNTELLINMMGKDKIHHLKERILMARAILWSWALETAWMYNLIQVLTSQNVSSFISTKSSSM